MSVESCVNSAVDQGELSRQEADDLLKLYRERVDGERAGGPGAERRARQALADDLEFASLRKRQIAALTAKAARERVADMRGHRTAKGEADVAEGLVSVFEGYRTGSLSVESLRKYYLSEAMRRMDKVIEAFDRTKITGVSRNKAQQRQVVDELFGKDTGDGVARALANAWSETAEWLRQSFNAAGGAIGKLEHWGLPQWHDPLALLNANRETWKAYVLPRLDLDKMQHPNGSRITADEIDKVLDDVFDTVTTQGWNKREPQMRPFGLGALANRYAEHRFLIFKDGQSWLEYQSEFGAGGDVFEAMMGHVALMSREIATLEKLGPNPEAMMHFLRQTVMKEAALKTAGKAADFAGSAKRATSRANSKLKLTEDMWAEMRGATNTPVASGPATFAANLRNVIVAARLGKAVLSAVATDPVFQAIARKSAGLSITSLPRDLARAVGKEGRMEALRSNLILDSTLAVFSGQARYLDDLQGSRFSRHIADRVLQLSGLSPWTQSSKHAFGLGFQATAADNARLAYGELDRAFRETLAAYGIDAAMWDRIRNAALYEPKPGATFLRPKEVLEADEAAGKAYVQMILQETEYAVPSTTVRGRASLTGGTRPGTFWGEVVRSGIMFKSFSATVVLLHGARLNRLIGSGGKARGAAYGGSVLMTLTMGGALALWLKDIAAGRDPRPIMNKKGNPAPFMLQAMLQGGGLGIFGDFIVADRNRYGGGLAQTLTGPVIESGNEFLNLTVGNAIELASGKSFAEAKVGKEAMRLGGSLVPGSSIWYLSTAWNRVFLDQLNYLADPAANQAFKSQQRYWKNNFNTGFWWRPGQTGPDRLPALGG